MEGDKRIDKYQFSLKKLLGQGSYATVYLGKEIETGESVAVKVIDKKIFSNAYNIKNIQSQIDIMKKVSHSNIVQLFDIYQTANNMYIVTELCNDGDLFKMLHQKKKIPQKEAKGYLKDIIDGAKYLHKNGIIHRDLKPANILLKQGVCKLSDFGFAKSLQSDQAVMKSIVGTPLYMSPQILKKQKYTAKSDLWSIGLIYYEMLHGRTPWPAQNELQLINGIYHKKIIFSSSVSETSKDFIKRCLQITENNRISWEEAFHHPLLSENSQNIDQLQLIPELHLDNKGKENVSSLGNKTPKNRPNNQEKKSPFLEFQNIKNISKDRIRNGDCLTPKDRAFQNGKTTFSNIKQKAQVTPKKAQETSIIKKKKTWRPSELFKNEGKTEID